MMMQKNISSDKFYPCYIDISRARYDMAFKFVPVSGDDETIINALGLHLSKVQHLTELFTEDKISEFARKYYQYYNQIQSLYNNAEFYLKSLNSQNDSTYKYDDSFCKTWEDTILFLYEKYRTAVSIFDRILYDTLLSDFLWNSKLDPANPAVKEYNLSQINKIISGATNIDMIEESSIIDKVKDKIKHIKFDIDDEGTILIKKNYKADLFQYYSNSVRMMKIYKDSSDLDKLKAELAKIYYINELIEIKYVYNNNLTDQEKKDYKKYIDLRSRILSSFKLYIVTVLEKDKGFDFNKYYENSPYSEIFSIRQKQVRGLKKLIAAIVI